MLYKKSAERLRHIHLSSMIVWLGKIPSYFTKLQPTHEGGETPEWDGAHYPFTQQREISRSSSLKRSFGLWISRRVIREPTTVSVRCHKTSHIPHSFELPKIALKWRARRMHARRIRTNADVERQNKLFDFCYIGGHICINKTATQVC